MTVTPQPNSYGSLAGVANYATAYCPTGTFTPTTVPTDAAVGAWLDQISAMLNGVAAGFGFVIPITQADVKNAVTGTVEQITADLVLAANNAGRFVNPTTNQVNVSPWSIIRKELYTWFQTASAGFEAMGAARTQATEETAWGFRDTDESGNPTAPIFQRGGFGNQFEDWDTGAGHSNVNWPPTGPGEQ
jgi:hypothetical protein